MSPSCERLWRKEKQVGRNEAGIRVLVNKGARKQLGVALVGGGATKRDQPTLLQNYLGSIYIIWENTHVIVLTTSIPGSS